MGIKVGTILDILPRPFPLTLGGREYLVGEFTLADLANIQAWLAERWPDPMGGLRDQIDGMSEEERRGVLRAAHAEAEAGPPTWGDARGRALLATGEGILEIFRIALRRYHPELEKQTIDAPDGEKISGVQEVAERTSTVEYAALRRRLYGVDPLDEIEAALGVDRSSGGEPIPWSQVVCELAEAYQGWTLEYIGSLTLSQVRAARQGGRPVVRGVPLTPGMDMKRMVAEARKRFHGPEKGVLNG